MAPCNVKAALTLIFFSPRGIWINEISVLLYHVLHFLEFHGGAGSKGLFKNKINEQGGLTVAFKYRIAPFSSRGNVAL